MYYSFPGVEKCFGYWNVRAISLQHSSDQNAEYQFIYVVECHLQYTSVAPAITVIGTIPLAENKNDKNL
jgi:hypothetical protein